jgi:hypothetical protein
MGLLDFIFGKDPEWVEVTEDTFSIEGTHKYSKAESKKLRYKVEAWFYSKTFINHIKKFF